MFLFSGIFRNSRLQYKTLNERFKDNYNLQINIKTLADEGIIFYSSNLNQQDDPDFVAVYVLDGKVSERFVHLTL